MQLRLLLLKLQLHLLDVLLHALHFELVALKLALDASLGATLVLQILRELHKHLILLELDRVTFAAELRRLAQQLLLLPLVCIEVTSKLPDKLSVLFIVSLGLECLVFNQQFTAFFPCLFFDFGDFFLKLMPLSIQLHLYDIKLSLCLIILLTKAIDLMLFGIKLNPVPALDVFLNFHAHDICIDWQSHLISHRVNLSLLLLDGPAHVIQTLFNGQFELLLGLNFFRKAFLKLSRLRAHLLIMTLEVSIECVDLLFFCDGSLKVALNSAQSSLQLIIFLP